MSQAPLNWTREGQGPVVVLSHALGCDISMWDGVAALLASRYTVLRYDHRGHGQSEAPTGPYTIEMFADDAAALIRAQAPGPVHFVGLSLGGMTAQALAVRHPALVMGGTLDEATPVALSQVIADSIPGAQMRTINAAHLSAVETPEAFARLLEEFLAGLK